MKTIILVLLSGLIFSTCADDPVSSEICHEGVVIGKIRSSGGGIAVSMKDSRLSDHNWNGFDNVVEALNIPETLGVSGKTIYFFARPATDNEKWFAVSADGAESAKPIIFVLEVSSYKCPETEDNATF